MITTLITKCCELATQCPQHDDTCILYIHDHFDEFNLSNKWNDYNYISQHNVTGFDDFIWVYSDWCYYTTKAFDWRCNNINNKNWIVITSFIILCILFMTMLIFSLYQIYKRCFINRSTESHSEISELSKNINV